jgi:hypothetical protein
VLTQHDPERARTTTTDPAAPGSAALLGAAVVAGAALGVADLLVQTALPYPWAGLGNSLAVWAVAAWAGGRRARAGAARTAVAGALGLAVAVEAYYAAAALLLRDEWSIAWSRTSVVWLFLAVVAGELFGAAGAVSVANAAELAPRRFHSLVRDVAAVLPTAVLAAEAVRQLGTRAPAADWWTSASGTGVLELAGAAVLLVPALRVRPVPRLLLAVPLCAAGAAAFVALGLGAVGS